jgi:predicted AAA+ superfamily ATPase
MCKCFLREIAEGSKRKEWKEDVMDILLALKSMLLNVKQEIKKMSQQTDAIKVEMAELVANVAANTDAVAAGVAAIEALTTKQTALIQELKDAQEANDPVAIQEALDGLIAQNDALVANTQKLAAAIPANTPVEPPV